MQLTNHEIAKHMYHRKQFFFFLFFLQNTIQFNFRGCFDIEVILAVI